KADARETYERALAEGRSGALLEQERASLFTQEIGNIPPGEHVEIHVTIDQPLLWIADASTQGSWEWRFPLAAAPRYLGGPTLGAESPHFSEGTTSARASLSLRVRDASKASPESPTHPLSHTTGGAETTFGSGNRVALDRDVAIRWTVATDSFETSLDTRGDAGRAYGLLTVVPPSRSTRPRSMPRDLTLLLDTSGSMQGEPLVQEKRIALALIDALTDDDTLEVIEFSSHTRAFEKKPAAATPARKRAASAWVTALQASGGTEMVSGVEAALRELRAESQRQVVLITDGLVGFERQLVRTILEKLPSGARLHAVGVGSAVNRSLVAPIARAGRGIEAIVGLGEDAERAALRLLARTSEPLAIDLRVEGPGVLRVVPSRLPDVFAHAPLRLAVELAPGGGEIVVRGRTSEGPFVQRIAAPRTEAGEGNPALTKLFARELVEDLEMQLSGGGSQSELEAEIARVGLEHQIASRLTSWVAVTTERTVDPRSPTRHAIQPQALVHGLGAEGLGLRAAQPTAQPLAFGSAMPDRARRSAPRMMRSGPPMG
ncbi:VWA domain-containing protein, partial [bacterium]